MSLNAEFREMWRQILGEIRRESRAAVAPFTVGGKLNLSSPHIVGTLAQDHGGTGGPAPASREPIVMGGELLLMGGDVITMGA